MYNKCIREVDTNAYTDDSNQKPLRVIGAKTRGWALTEPETLLAG